MNSKILTIMPSRGRPKECKNAIKSFLETCKTSNLAVLLDEDDPLLSEYFNISHKIFWWIKKRDTITNRINRFVMQNLNDYKFFHLTNDDVIYHTKDWDVSFMNRLEENGHGIIYGDDLFQRENLPTFPFISQEIVKAVGWFQMPLLNRYYGDMVWKYIGQNAGCLYYCHYITIEHMHQLAGKGEYPVDMEIYEKDGQAFAQWLATSATRDINKVRRLYDTTS